MKWVALFASVLAIALLSLSGIVVFKAVEPREEYALSGKSTETPAPFDRVQQSNVQVYSDRAIIYMAGLRWANLSATGSMLPVLSHGSHAIQIVPKFPEDIHIGDIVSYNLDGVVIIHRVIGTGTDGKGVYFITKGDNNPEPDPEPVRFSQIDRVVIGILY
ncbi:MAG: signal peptidase I [Candidatus Woesearchaeota archaeon]